MYHFYSKLLVVLCLFVCLTGSLYGQRLPLFHYPKVNPASMTKSSYNVEKTGIVRQSLQQNNFIKELISTDSLNVLAKNNRRLWNADSSASVTFSKKNSGIEVHEYKNFKIPILKREIEALTKTSNTLADSVNAILNKTTYSSSDQQLANIINDSILSITTQISGLQKQIAVESTASLLTGANTIWPVFMGKRYDRDSLNSYLYNQQKVDVFQNFTGQFGKNTFVNPEFASALLGKFRLGISGFFQATGDTSKDNATRASLQKVLGGGGSLAANISIPIVFVTSATQQTHFGIFAQTAFGFSPMNGDTLGASTFYNDVAFSNQVGVTFSADFMSNDITRNARISIELPCYYIWGSQNSYRQLNLPDFSIIQLRVGLVINNLLSFQISGPLLSTSTIVQHSPYNLSLVFSPTQILKSGGQ